MKEHLLKLLSEGKTKKVIKLLLEITKKTDLHDNVIKQSISFSYKDYESKKETNSIGQQKISITEVNTALREIINDLNLKDDDFKHLLSETEEGKTNKKSGKEVKTVETKIWRKISAAILGIGAVIVIPAGIAEITGYSLKDLCLDKEEVKKAEIEISNSKNLNLGNIKTNSGDVHIGDNYSLKSVEYNELLERIEELEELVRITEDPINKFRYSEKLSTQIRNKKAFEKDVKELAEIFNKIEINTERLKQAKQFFDKGKFKEARSILDTKEIESDQEKLLQKKRSLQDQNDENKKALKNNSDEYLVLAKLTSFDFRIIERFDKTTKFFERSLISNKNERNLLAYASFLQEHNQDIIADSLFDEAVIKYRKLVLSQPNFHLLDFAAALDLYVISLTKVKKFKKAEEIYEELIEIKRKLAVSDSITFSACLSHTLNSLGVYQSKSGQYLKAEQSFNEAIEILRKVAFKDSIKYLPNLASSLTNLGMVQHGNRNYELAEKHYIEAFEIYLSQKDICPDNHVVDLLYHYAITVNGLGLLFEDKQEFEKAENFLLFALENRKLLAELSPKIYLIVLAETQINISYFYKKSKINKKLSVKYADEAIVSLLPFKEMPHIKDKLKRVYRLLNHWNINVEEYLKENHPVLTQAP